ncbi:hypothetical protein [Paenibacillus sp. WC2504]|uniref:hypothetical protein n=1 Tax=Paenibacillus sp. WC2504 TaxID=3461403 RepID=UPI0040454D2C
MDEKRGKKTWVSMKFPASNKLSSLVSSINRNASIGMKPYIIPNSEEKIKAIEALGFNKDEDPKCVYCGEEMTCWDHLNSMTLGSKETEFITSISNAVPSCLPCNTGRGNIPYALWLRTGEKRAAYIRDEKKVNIENVIKKIDKYIEWSDEEIQKGNWVPYKADINRIIYEDEELVKLKQKYDSLKDEIIDLLKHASKIGEKIRERITKTSYPNYHKKGLESNKSLEKLKSNLTEEDLQPLRQIVDQFTSVKTLEEIYELKIEYNKLLKQAINRQLR